MMHVHTVEARTLLSNELSQDCLLSPLSCFVFVMQADWPSLWFGSPAHSVNWPVNRSKALLENIKQNLCIV